MKESTAAPRDASPVAIGCGVVLLLMGVCYFSVSRDAAQDQAREKVEGSLVGAWTACQEFVRAKVSNPAAASFPTQYEQYVQFAGEGRFRASAYVDSDRRHQFACEVRLIPGSGRYELVRLDLR